MPEPTLSKLRITHPDVVENGETTRFDFTLSVVKEIENISASCGCVKHGFTKVGTHKRQGNEFPVYRFQIDINVNMKKFNPNLPTKTNTKKMTIFYKRDDKNEPFITQEVELVLEVKNPYYESPEGT